MKEFRFRSLIALILMMCCTLGYAQTFEIDGLTYQVLFLDRKGVWVSGVENKSIAAVNIPSSIVINGEEYMVKNIGEEAFARCSSLTSITIPSSVTSIGREAFRGCSSLTSIDLPDGVTNIGSFAFYGSSSLTSITIPSSVTSIGLWAFERCEGLAQIKVDSGNPVYDSRDNCNAIIETKSNTLIAGCAKTIIPRGVKSIGDWAFDECKSLTSITIPNSVTSIGKSAFAGCDNLTSITIPSSVTSIGEEAFRGCEALRSITIPNSVTSIGEEAFRGCSNLTSITISGSVTSIGEAAFGGCDKLTKIKVTPGNPVYDSRNNCNAIIETKSNTLIAGCASTVIPSSVTSIGKSAFAFCESLTSINIPSSVTSIGEGAFESCDNLTSITIPSSVTCIGDAVFQGCDNLKTITIPQHFNDYSDHNLYRWDVQVGAKIIWKGKTDKEPSRSIIYEGPQIDDLKSDQTAGGSISVY